MKTPLLKHARYYRWIYGLLVALLGISLAWFLVGTSKVTGSVPVRKLDNSAELARVLLVHSNLLQIQDLTRSQSPGPRGNLEDLLLTATIQHRVNDLEISNLPVALDYIMGSGQMNSSADLPVLLLRRWAETAPAPAAAWTQKVPAGEIRQDAVRNVAIVWAGQASSNGVTTTAVLHWAAGLTNFQERQTAFYAIAYEIARSNPKQALDLSAELLGRASRNDLIVFASGQWASTSPAAAADWAGQIPDEDLREQVLGRIAIVEASQNPGAAANQALQLPPGRIQNDALTQAISRWLAQKPADANHWVASLPPGAPRDLAAAILNPSPTAVSR